mmetsp:Transcript_10645/g.22621  ORF Transcript_10645/g.22621 Transcript_10645/m.22621 type:complete len:87 (-) Transcript_10645:1829-2089(-)
MRVCMRSTKPFPKRIESADSSIFAERILEKDITSKTQLQKYSNSKKGESIVFLLLNYATNPHTGRASECTRQSFRISSLRRRGGRR